MQEYVYVGTEDAEVLDVWLGLILHLYGADAILECSSRSWILDVSHSQYDFRPEDVINSTFQDGCSHHVYYSPSCSLRYAVFFL